jgi:hypothetical protein
VLVFVEPAGCGPEASVSCHATALNVESVEISTSKVSGDEQLFWFPPVRHIGEENWRRKSPSLPLATDKLVGAG